MKAKEVTPELVGHFFTTEQMSQWIANTLNADHGEDPLNDLRKDMSVSEMESLQDLPESESKLKAMLGLMQPWKAQEILDLIYEMDDDGIDKILKGLHQDLGREGVNYCEVCNGDARYNFGWKSDASVSSIIEDLVEDRKKMHKTYYKIKQIMEGDEE